MKKLILLFAILLVSCDKKQERIDELETENAELKENISELENERDELQEKIDNARSSIEDAKIYFVSGNFNLGLIELDDAEIELNY